MWSGHAANLIRLLEAGGTINSSTVKEDTQESSPVRLGPGRTKGYMHTSTRIGMWSRMKLAFVSRITCKPPHRARAHFSAGHLESAPFPLETKKRRGSPSECSRVDRHAVAQLRTASHRSLSLLISLPSVVLAFLFLLVLRRSPRDGARVGARGAQPRRHLMCQGRGDFATPDRCGCDMPCCIRCLRCGSFAFTEGAPGVGLRDGFGGVHPTGVVIGLSVSRHAPCRDWVLVAFPRGQAHRRFDRQGPSAVKLREEMPRRKRYMEDASMCGSLARLRSDALRGVLAWLQPF